MKPCRACKHEISEQAMACPHCGEPFPAKDKFDGWGFEYRSEACIAGWPLVHISFKYTPSRRPVPARGIIAIGQFACGVITVSQFGIGVISVSQFTIAGFALAQFAVAYSLIAQMGIYVHEGHGQIVRSIAQLLTMSE
jgi:hypothetical protein